VRDASQNSWKPCGPPARRRNELIRIGATPASRFFLTTPFSLFLSLPLSSNPHPTSPIQTRPRPRSATPRSGPRSWKRSRASPRFSRGLPVRREEEEGGEILAINQWWTSIAKKSKPIEGAGCFGRCLRDELRLLTTVTESAGT
jgi:hypothetical protein